MALTEFEDAIIFWFSRAVIAHEKLAKAAEETLVIDQECAAIEEEPEVGKAPEIEPLYVPDGVEPVSLKSSKVIPFRSLDYLPQTITDNLVGENGVSDATAMVPDTKHTMGGLYVSR